MTEELEVTLKVTIALDVVNQEPGEMSEKIRKMFLQPHIADAIEISLEGILTTEAFENGEQPVDINPKLISVDAKDSEDIQLRSKVGDIPIRSMIVVKGVLN